MTSIKSYCPTVRRKIYVSDDWYPCYFSIQTGKPFVEVRISTSIYDGQYIVYTSVWGADDTGLEKEFCTLSLKEAINFYRQQKKFFKKIRSGIRLKSYLIKNGYKWC